MAVTKRELDQAFTDYEGKYGGRKEDYFAALWIAAEFEKRFEDVAHQIAFGGNDYGVDGFYLDRETGNLFLYQFKWSENHTLFRESLKRLTEHGMARIFGNPKQDQQQNQMLLQLKSKLDELQAIVKHVRIYFIFNGDPEAAEQSAQLDALREDLESKKYLVDDFFGRSDVSLTVQYLSNQTHKLGGRSHTRKTHQYEIEFPAPVSATPHGTAKLTVGFVRLMDLHRMYQEMGQRLFERNIRSGLSAERAANRALKRAMGRIVLEGKDPAEIFAFNHNGVTIAVERLEIADGRARLTEPRILNGAQTITTLERFLADNEDNRALEQGREPLASLQVLAKVVSEAPAEFVVGVTICNNQQNPVEPWNLRASDQMQLALQDKFRDDLGIFYERQENSFETLTDDDLEEMGVEERKALQIRRLAQTFLAIQGEIDKVSRMTDVFENEANYKSAFRDGYLRADSRRILCAYKIQLRLNRVIKEIIAKGAQKYAYMQRAKNLVWALLIQAMFNDEYGDLEERLDRHGKGMTVEAEFTEWLCDLASRRVRLIIGEALSDDRSAQLIAEGKFSFVRTKAVYERCMKVAYDRFKWTKHSL